MHGETLKFKKLHYKYYTKREKT